MVMVEVRQGTLGVDGRGWSPAGSRRRGDEERTRRGEEKRGEEEEEKEDEKREEKEEDEEEATDIKSNNPHLAGGEQQDIPKK